MIKNCYYCKHTILFGGVKDKGLTYCNKKCHALGYVVEMEEDEVLNIALDIHEGNCPKCGGSGPVDLYKSFLVYSVLVITSHQDRLHLCCVNCGSKAISKDLMISALAGWWGFPFGFIITPIQVIRGLVALASKPSPERPSSALIHAVRTCQVGPI